jgi:hypothetical protein
MITQSTASVGGRCRLDAPAVTLGSPLVSPGWRAVMGRPSVTGPSYFADGPPVPFTCPATGMYVQHWLDDDEDAPENRYEPITCPACTRLHFLNRKTGKRLGPDDES